MDKQLCLVLAHLCCPAAVPAGSPVKLTNTFSKYVKLRSWRPSLTLHRFLPGKKKWFLTERSIIHQSSLYYCCTITKCAKQKGLFIFSSLSLLKKQLPFEVVEISGLTFQANSKGLWSISFHRKRFDRKDTTAKGWKTIAKTQTLLSIRIRHVKLRTVFIDLFLLL